MLVLASRYEREQSLLLVRFTAVVPVVDLASTIYRYVPAVPVVVVCTSSRDPTTGKTVHPVPTTGKTVHPYGAVVRYSTYSRILASTVVLYR